MKTSTIRRIIIAVILLAAAAVVAMSLLKNNSEAAELVIDFYRVKTGVMEEKISGTGTFVARTSSAVTAKVSGVVEALYAKEGEKVRTGDILLEIDSEDYRQNLESRQVTLESTRRSARQNLLSLRANYQAAALSYEQALRNYENNKVLFEADGVSEEVLKQSEDALLTAELNVKSTKELLNVTIGRPLAAEPVLDDSGDDGIISGFPEIIQAELAIETARKNVANCTVRSPISGTVTQVLMDEDATVSMNTPLVIIEALDDMIAEIQIDEVDIGKIKKNSPAEVTSDSLLGKTLNGTVESISPVILSVGNTRMTKVRVAIDPDGNQLKSGASCTVRISATTKESALVIPLTAYTAENEISYVYVLEKKTPIPGNETTGASGANSGMDDPAGAAANPDAGMPEIYVMKKREIELGIITVNQVEVVSGLAEGEFVAMGNQSLFRENIEGKLGEEK